MLVIPIYLHPSTGGEPQQIGRATIVNTGTGTRESGTYRCTFRDRYQGRDRDRVAYVDDFPRLDQGPWELLHAALSAALAPAKEVRRD